MAEGIFEIVKIIREKLPDAYLVLPVHIFWIETLFPIFIFIVKIFNGPICSFALFQTLLPRGQQPNKLREKHLQVNKLIAERFSTNRKDKVQTVQIDKGLVQADGTISHHDMFDYLNLTNAGYKKVFEPIFDLLSQILSENEPEKDLTPSEWNSIVIYFAKQQLSLKLFALISIWKEEEEEGKNHYSYLLLIAFHEEEEENSLLY